MVLSSRCLEQSIFDSEGTSVGSMLNSLGDRRSLSGELSEQPIEGYLPGERPDYQGQVYLNNGSAGADL